MTRQDYIEHLDHLRRGVLELIEYDRKFKKQFGQLTKPQTLETERAKKTEKMFFDLEARLYEDAAVSERVKQDMKAAGDFEQAELSLMGGEE